VAADSLVFDAEPLIAHADGEPGSGTVEARLDEVAAEGTDGYVNHVTLAEVRYVLARKYDRDTAERYVEWLADLGVSRVGTERLWVTASEHVLAHNPALGDAFALATAGHLDATLLVGGDDDYDDVEDVRVERFRDGPA